MSTFCFSTVRFPERKFKVSPYEMDNYVYCITLAWLLWRFAFDAVMASKGICDKTLKPVDPVYILFGCHTAASRPPFCHRKACVVESVVADVSQ